MIAIVSTVSSPATIFSFDWCGARVIRAGKAEQRRLTWEAASHKPAGARHDYPARKRPPARRPILDPLVVLLPAARLAARRVARRRGLVFRLWRQYARPRLSRPAPHAAGRAAHRTHPRLPPPLQSRRLAA